MYFLRFLIGQGLQSFHLKLGDFDPRVLWNVLMLTYQLLSLTKQYFVYTNDRK